VLSAGLLLGLSVAAPVGPMGLLVINRTLSRGFASGLATGLGIAVGDAAYGALAASGLAVVAQFIQSGEIVLRLGGGAFLIWLGVQAWRQAGAPREMRVAATGGLARSFAIAVGLTLTNPATILSFVAYFGALGLAAGQGGAAILVAGVFLGSALWWLCLSATLAIARTSVTQRLMSGIDHASAVVLAGFGAIAIASVWLRNFP
jgi:threonine/homoserine/homoserine lactone efflux protein